MNTAIRRAGQADADALALVVADAYHDLTPARWLLPEPEERARVFPYLFRLLLEHAIAYGEAYTVTGANAVAVWFDATGGRPPAMTGYAERIAGLTGPWTDRFELLDEVRSRHHPPRPHHYLALLAVRPGYQRAGLGTALLDHHHAHLDRYAIPAYVEASSPQSRDLYLRYGYEPMHPAIIVPDGPPLWPMWRRPKLNLDDRWPR
jgi:ribosomal protein S18 acetylase RimI-like enzyme